MAMFTPAPTSHTGRKTSAAVESAPGPPTSRPTTRQAARTRSPTPMTIAVCTPTSLHLADVQPVDLPGGPEVEAEVGPEVSPLLRVEVAHHLEPVRAHPVDGREALVAERIAGEVPEAARLAVVEQLRSVLEEGGPGSGVTLLEGVDGGLHRGVLQGGRNHRARLAHAAPAVRPVPRSRGAAPPPPERRPVSGPRPRSGAAAPPPVRWPRRAGRARRAAARAAVPDRWAGLRSTSPAAPGRRAASGSRWPSSPRRAQARTGPAAPPRSRGGPG